MARLRKWLILSHRYLGIALGLLAVMWFATGIAMMYAGGMPTLTPAERLEGMPPLELSEVRVTPARAAELAGPSLPFDSLALVTVLGRPAYRFGGMGGAVTAIVFADDAQLLGDVHPGAARLIAAAFLELAPERLHHEARLTSPDQWTFAHRARMPLHRFRADDGADSRIYVSERSGEVVLVTTGGSRLLAWVAAIPHWLYLRVVRARSDLWYNLVLVTSGLVCVLAGLGLALAVVQARVRRPFRLSRLREYVPYRGWMRWHYLAGAVFGVITLTWAFSGFLSMEPWGWASGRDLELDPLRAALAGRPFDPTTLPPLEPERWEGRLPGREIKEIRYVAVLGEFYYQVSSTPGPGRALLRATTLEPHAEPLPTDTLVHRVAETYPRHPVEGVDLLHDYDAYYYAREDSYSRGGVLPLPVVRVKLGDPERTWLYIDASTGELRQAPHRLDRIERWLYNGLHSLDFGFWYRNRPLWDVGVIVLLLGGLVSSATGLYLGGRRLWRARSTG